MYKAVRQWRGDSPDSKVVDRVIEDSKRESEQNGRAYKKKIAKMFWRDPFSDSPRKLIPVRPEDRETVASQGGDSSPKVLKELVAARADAAMARAEAAKMRADLARAEAVAARAEAVAARQACSEVNHRPVSAEYRAPRPRASNQARHIADRSDREQALKTLVSRRESRSDAPAPAPTPAADPPVSSDPRGIIVIPITATIPKH